MRDLRGPVVLLLLAAVSMPVRAASLLTGGGWPRDARPAQLSSFDNLRVWQSFTAGHSDLAGSAALGTQPLDAGATSLTFGADAAFGPLSLAGLSVSTGRQTFSGRGGHGVSKDRALTLYGRKDWQEFYLSGALGLGWHDLSTERTRVFGLDVLTARFTAQDIGGRLEIGGSARWTDWGAFAPFAALVGDSYRQPAYAEQSSLGASPFAVRYAAHVFNTGHFELGLRYGKQLALAGWPVSVDAQLAWQHQLDGVPFIKGAYVNFDASDFALPGTQPARNTLLLGMGARIQGTASLSLGLRGDSRIGNGTNMHSATADLVYRW
jgi:uncharacterized protein with beta-barrel porin domain